MIKSYWLYNRDGYTRPLPDFQQQIVDDNPQPEILPVTLGEQADPSQKRPTGVNFQVTPSDVITVVDKTESELLSLRNVEVTDNRDRRDVKVQAWSETEANDGTEKSEKERKHRHHHRHHHENDEEGERRHRKKHRRRHRSASMEECDNIVQEIGAELNDADEDGKRKHRKHRHHHHHHRRHRSVPADGEVGQSEQTSQQQLESEENDERHHRRRHHSRRRHHRRHRSASEEGKTDMDLNPLAKKYDNEGRLPESRDDEGSINFNNNQKSRDDQNNNNNSKLFVSSQDESACVKHVKDTSKADRATGSGNGKVTFAEEELQVFTRRISRCRVGPAPDTHPVGVTAAIVSNSVSQQTTVENLE